jgi:hypothetical protein
VDALLASEFGGVDDAAAARILGAELSVEQLVKDDECDHIPGHRALVEGRVHADQSVLVAPGAEANRSPTEAAVRAGPADASAERSRKVSAVLHGDDLLEVVVSAAESLDSGPSPLGRTKTKALCRPAYDRSGARVACPDQIRSGSDHFIALEGELALHPDPKDPRIPAAPRDERPSVVGSDQINRLPQ